MKVGSFLLWRNNSDIVGIILDMKEHHWEIAWFFDDCTKFVNLSEIDTVHAWNRFWMRFYSGVRTV